MTSRTVHPAGRRRPRTDLRRTASTALAPAVWGTTYIVTTEFLPSGHPMFAGLLRALPAGLIAPAATRTLPCGAWWGKTAVLGVLYIGLFLALLFTATERLPGGVAATMSAAQPLLVTLLAVTVLGERLSARLAWGAVGVVGVGQTLGPVQLAGFALALAVLDELDTPRKHRHFTVGYQGPSSSGSCRKVRRPSASSCGPGIGWVRHGTLACSGGSFCYECADRVNHLHRLCSGPEPHEIHRSNVQRRLSDRYAHGSLRLPFPAP